jgi:hypothetical protein
MSRLKMLLAALPLAALSACVVAPPRHVVYTEPGGVIAEVDVAPPPPQVEVVPAVPYAGAVWVGGYWGWNAGRHVWIGGHYEHPRPGYVWEPHRWVVAGGHWRLMGGGWRAR